MLSGHVCSSFLQGDNQIMHVVFTGLFAWAANQTFIQYPLCAMVIAHALLVAYLSLQKGAAASDSSSSDEKMQSLKL